MAKEELGTKRVDPETGKKFYDLGRDPVISPYTGKSYPRSFFDSYGDSTPVVEEDIDTVLEEPDLLQLEATDDADADEEDNLPTLDDKDTNDDVELDSEVFLDEDTDDNSEVLDIIGEVFVDEN